MDKCTEEVSFFFQISQRFNLAVQVLSSPYFLGNTSAFQHYAWGREDDNKNVNYVHTLRSIAPGVAGNAGLYVHPREFRVMGVLKNGIEGVFCPMESLVYTHPRASLVVNEDQPRLLARQLDVMAICRALEATCPDSSTRTIATFMEGHKVKLLFPRMFEVGTLLMEQTGC